MADISQFNIPLPVEADSTVSLPESPKSDSDGALFEDLLVEAGAEATAASTSTEATPTVSGEHVSETERQLAPTAAFTTTVVPGVEGTPEVLLETLRNQNSAAGSLTVDNLAGNLAHNELSEEVVSQLLARSTTDSQAIEQAVFAEFAKTAVGEAVSKSEVPVGAPVNTVALRADTVVDPTPSGNVEPSAVARSANVGLVEQPAVATAGDPEQVLVRTNPDSVQVNREAGNSRTAEFVPTTGSATAPAVALTGTLNPLVQPGDGKSLKSLDLETLGVTRIEITAEHAGSNQTPAGQVKVMAPEAVSQPAPRPEPTLAMLGLRSSAEVLANVSTGPLTQGQTTGNETVPVPDSVDSATLASQSSRPEVTTVSGAGLEAQVTSQYVLKEGTTGRRIAADSKVVVRAWQHAFPAG